MSIKGTVILLTWARAFGGKELFEIVLAELDLLEPESATMEMDQMRMDCYVALRRWDQLLKLSLSLQQKLGQDKELLRAQAVALAGAGHLDECVELLDKSLILYPGNPELETLRKKKL